MRSLGRVATAGQSCSARSVLPFHRFHRDPSVVRRAARIRRGVTMTRIRAAKGSCATASGTTIGRTHRVRRASDLTWTVGRGWAVAAWERVRACDEPHRRRKEHARPPLRIGAHRRTSVSRVSEPEPRVPVHRVSTCRHRRRRSRSSFERMASAPRRQPRRGDAHPRAPRGADHHIARMRGSNRYAYRVVSPGGTHPISTSERDT